MVGLHEEIFLVPENYTLTLLGQKRIGDTLLNYALNVSTKGIYDESRELISSDLIKKEDFEVIIYNPFSTKF